MNTITTPISSACPIHRERSRFRRSWPRALGADEGRQHDHRQTQHDDLVDADHQRRPRRRQLDLPQHLPIRAAGHDAGLAHLRRHALEAEDGQARHHRKSEDDGGDGAGLVADADEDGDRDHVGEMRQRLHDVEDRPQQLLEPRLLVGDDAERRPDRAGDRRRHQHHRQGDHRQFPFAEDRHVGETDAGNDAEPAALQVPAEHDRQAGYGNPGQARNGTESAKPPTRMASTKLSG